jgi:hypothetical protein
MARLPTMTATESSGRQAIVIWTRVEGIRAERRATVQKAHEPAIDTKHNTGNDKMMASRI